MEVQVQISFWEKYYLLRIIKCSVMDLREVKARLLGKPVWEVLDKPHCKQLVLFDAWHLDLLNPITEWSQSEDWMLNRLCWMDIFYRLCAWEFMEWNDWNVPLKLSKYVHLGIFLPTQLLALSNYSKRNWFLSCYSFDLNKKHPFLASRLSLDWLTSTVFFFKIMVWYVGDQSHADTSHSRTYVFPQKKNTHIHPF